MIFRCILSFLSLTLVSVPAQSVSANARPAARTRMPTASIERARAALPGLARQSGNAVARTGRVIRRLGSLAPAEAERVIRTEAQRHGTLERGYRVIGSGLNADAHAMESRPETSASSVQTMLAAFSRTFAPESSHGSVRVSLNRIANDLRDGKYAPAEVSERLGLLPLRLAEAQAFSAAAPSGVGIGRGGRGTSSTGSLNRARQSFALAPVAERLSVAARTPEEHQAVAHVLIPLTNGLASAANEATGVERTRLSALSHEARVSHASHSNAGHRPTPSRASFPFSIAEARRIAATAEEPVSAAVPVSR
jgi:hypothetical protein